MKANEEERLAKQKAAEAKKAAKAEEKARKEKERSVERVREYERVQKAEEERLQTERQRRCAISAERKDEVTQWALDAEESRNEQIERLHNFYTYSLNKSGELSIKINMLRMVECLRNMGFYRYDQADGTFEYVRIQGGKIRLIGSSDTDIQKIIDAFEDYVSGLPERHIFLDQVIGDDVAHVEKVITPTILTEKLYNGLSSYFSQTLPRLRPKEDSPVKNITILHDTKDAKYFFYNNVVVRVTRDGRDIIPYDEIHQRLDEYGEENGYYIWQNSILDRDYIDYGDQPAPAGDFENLCWYVSGHGSELPAEDVRDRMKCLMSILGYMMHDNYECNNKLALFIDAKIEDGMSSGGTGKGIIGKGLRAMINRVQSDRKYISVAGKGLDTKSNTRYSTGDITTQVIHIEDAERNLNFEDLYSDITEGATFRKLHHDPTSHFAKIMISTNCPFNINAESTKRRIVLFELSPYFSSKRTPEEVFGRRLFERDWNAMDWGCFDDFMIRCSEVYMREGLIEHGELNYVDNYLIGSLGGEVYHWMNGTIFGDAMEKRSQVCFKVEDLWTMFNKKYPDRYNVRNSFTKAIKLFLRTKKIPSGILRSTDDMLIVYPAKDTKLTDVIFGE